MAAQALGKAIARDLGVPFFFDATDRHSKARWWDAQPSPPPAEHEVVWALREVDDDGGVREDAGRRVEVAQSGREAHRRVIEGIRASVKGADPGQRGIQRLEFRAMLLGLEEGPITYSSRLTPTTLEVW